MRYIEIGKDSCKLFEVENKQFLKQVLSKMDYANEKKLVYQGNDTYLVLIYDDGTQVKFENTVAEGLYKSVFGKSAKIYNTAFIIKVSSDEWTYDCTDIEDADDYDLSYIKGMIAQ